MGPTTGIFSELPEYPRPKRRRLFSRFLYLSIGLTILLALYTSREPLGNAYQQYARPHLAPIVDSAKTTTTTTTTTTTDQDHSAQVIAGDTAPVIDSLETTAIPDSHQTQNPYSNLETQTSAPSEPTPSGPPIPDDEPIFHGFPKLRLPLDLQALLQWDPPKLEGHDPPYGTFFMSDYDPNRWEAFEQNTAIFTEGTIGQEARKHEAKPYKPYPKYNSALWRKEWLGDYVPCIGFRGVPYNESDEDVVKAFKLKPGQFPQPDAGSFEALGLDDSVCFERDSRLGSVGLHLERDTSLGALNLGELQDQCLERNQNRYEYSDTPELRPGKFVSGFRPGQNEDYNAAHKASGQTHKGRTAVLIRAWEGYEYEANDVQAIRSLVSELSLQSGGEYHVFLFVNIKDEQVDIFDDAAAYERKLDECVPAEFRDMTILWSEKLCESVYPNVGEYRVNVMQYMPVQWFMATHPEFEYLWNWEMDARYIGQTYHFLEAIARFAKKQPRKNLVERNARFFFQSSFATYADFFNDTNRAIERSKFVGSMWGPDESLVDYVLGPQPPTSAAEDDYSWGVGEEADFVSLLPIWDPLWTAWGWRHTIFNYEDPFVTRRAYINTHARFSRRLLHAMHEENLRGRCMMAEMWPTSVAMHHGLKAVYAPQPVWFSQKWPAGYKELVFNSDGWGAGSFYNESDPNESGVNMGVHTIVEGRGAAYNETRARLQLPQAGTGPNGEGALARWTQERDSVYNVDREHNFKGWSWYYHSDFGRMLYWRWLGWRQGFSDSTIGWDEGLDAMPDAGTTEWEERHGRLCLPSMLLHPVKHVTLDQDRPAEPMDGSDNNVPDMPPDGQRLTPQQQQEQQDEQTEQQQQDQWGQGQNQKQGEKQKQDQSQNQKQGEKQNQNQNQGQSQNQNQNQNQKQGHNKADQKQHQGTGETEEEHAAKMYEHFQGWEEEEADGSMQRRR